MSQGFPTTGRAHSPTEIALALTLASEKLEAVEAHLEERADLNGNGDPNAEMRRLCDVRDVQDTLKRTLEALAHVVAVVEKLPDEGPRPRPAILEILTDAGFRSPAEAQRAVRRAAARHWGIR